MVVEAHWILPFPALGIEIVFTQTRVIIVDSTTPNFLAYIRKDPFLRNPVTAEIRCLLRH